MYARTVLAHTPHTSGRNENKNKQKISKERRSIENFIVFCNNKNKKTENIRNTKKKNYVLLQKKKKRKN